jgi:hypothetical protein
MGEADSSKCDMPSRASLPVLLGGPGPGKVEVVRVYHLTLQSEAPLNRVCSLEVSPENDSLLSVTGRAHFISSRRHRSQSCVQLTAVVRQLLGAVKLHY